MERLRAPEHGSHGLDDCTDHIVVRVLVEEEEEGGDFMSEH